MTQAEFEFVRASLANGVNNLIEEIAQNNNIVAQLRKASAEQQAKPQKTEKTENVKKGEKK